MQSRAKVRVRPFPLSAPKQPEPFKAARALVRRKFCSRADRWHGCTAYREFSGIVLDSQKANLCDAAAAAMDCFQGGRGMRLIAENLGGERGGEPVFSGVHFALAQGRALIVTGPNGSG